MVLQIIPTPDTIPVNWWWFQILLIVTFLLHIILMNFILGGSILTLVDTIRGKSLKKDALAIPTLIALTINFGVPPLLFVQVLYGNFFYSSSIIMAIPWILVIPLLILAYYGAYVFVFKSGKAKIMAKTSLFITTAILLVIAFIYVNNNTLMLDPGRWSMYFENPSGANLNWSEPTLFPRYLHFIIGAIAIAGLGKAVFFHFKKNIEKEEQQKQIRQGLKIFAYTTMVQVVVGIWFLISLPRDIMMLFMGENFLYTVLLISGITLSLLTLVFALTNKLTPTILATLIVLVIMITTRELLRSAYLGEIFKPSSMEVTGMYSSLILFLAIFVIGLLSLYYMINLIFKSKTS